MENKNLVRFLVTFFLGFIGSIIINHSSLKPEGWKSNTILYIVPVLNLICAIMNFKFDAAAEKNLGYKKEA